MLQGHLCSLSGNGKRQRREEEEASGEAHHLEGGGYHSIQSQGVAEEGKALCKREGEIGDLLLVPGSFGPGLRHKFAASSALGRHRNKGEISRCQNSGTASKLDFAGRRIQVKRSSCTSRNTPQNHILDASDGVMYLR
jgi:hypothetical protein